MSVNRSSAGRNLSYSSTEFIVVIWCLFGPLGIVVVFRISSFIGAAAIYVLVRSSLLVADPLGFVTTKPEARLIVQTRRRIFFIVIIIIMVKIDMDCFDFFMSNNQIEDSRKEFRSWSMFGG